MDYLESAIDEAGKAYQKGEVPVGAVIVKDQEIIAKAHNLKETKKDALAHAEILAIQKAQKKLGDWRLNECTLYSTLEPCPMCAGAIIQARISKVVFGAYDLKWGAAGTITNLFEENLFNHNVEVIYSNNKECSKLLSDFFKSLR
jgi:tRNA(adenine34) deaminase